MAVWTMDSLYRVLLCVCVGLDKEAAILYLHIAVS